jgi:RHS repeat-associated protein
VAYRPFGPEEQIVFSNGTTRTADYDLRYRPLQNKLAAGSDIARYDYTSDPAGNVTTIDDAINPAYNRTFAYDDLNRLVTANSGLSLWGGGGYSYDAMGNMLTGTLGGTTTTFSYQGTTPKLLSVSGAPVSYDGAGNETAVGGSLFVYSPRNLLAGGEGMAYQYDGRGLRTTAMQIPAGSPAVLDIAPPSGPAAGGTSLTITGANFSAATTVTIAGIAATIANWTPTKLTVTTPPASAGTLATIVITNPGNPSTSTVNGHIYDFSDVPSGNPTYPFVITMARNGITSGCAPGTFCPNNPVLRSQMAIFLLRAKHGGSYVPPPATGTMFDDVPIGSFGAAWIEQLAREGVTGGCQANPPLYCPNASVTRAQMAIFLLRTKYGSAYQPPPATGTVFGDVPAGGVPNNFIEQLAREGISGGCQASPPLYCPNASITRAQMAIFLVRAVNLQEGIRSTLTRRHFLYSPELHLLAETEITTNPSPAVLYEYVWMNNHPVAQVEPVTNTTYCTFTDSLGTPLLLTRTDTSTFWRAEHEPYGKVFALRGNDEHQPLRLPGQEAEQFNLGPNGATERSYNIFRWYRAGWGRYTQADPIGFESGDTNWYAYAGGNAVGFSDPLGLQTVGTGVGNAVIPLYGIYRDFRDRRARAQDEFRNRSEMRHCVFSCRMALDYGESLTRGAGFVNEAQGFVMHDLRLLRSRLSGQTAWAFQPEDLVNNERGFVCARRIRQNRQCTTCETCCRESIFGGPQGPPAPSPVFPTPFGPCATVNGQTVCAPIGI